jgi:hypothetical protein
MIGRTRAGVMNIKESSDAWQIHGSSLTFMAPARPTPRRGLKIKQIKGSVLFWCHQPAPGRDARHSLSDYDTSNSSTGTISPPPPSRRVA